MLLETRGIVYFAKRISEYATARADLVGAHFGLIARRLQPGENGLRGRLTARIFVASLETQDRPHPGISVPANSETPPPRDG